MRKRFFDWMAHTITRAPRLTLLLAGLLTIATTYLAATQLVTNTNQDDLLSGELEFHARYQDFLDNFGDQEYLYVVVDARQHPARAKDFVDSLQQKLINIDSVTHSIAKLDMSTFARNALLYLSDEQSTSLLQQLATPHTGYQAMQSWRSVNDMLQSVQLGMRNTGNAADAQESSQQLTFFNHFLSGLNNYIQGEGAYQSPYAQLAPQDTAATMSDDGYLQLAGGRYLLMQIMPAKNYTTLEVIAEPLRELRAALDATRAEFPGIQAGLTGRPILAADEMAATNRDMMLSTIVALVSIFLLFIISLRRIVEPSFALLTLLVGMSWTYGFATMSIGSLNLLSIVFSVILVGAGIEFGLHMVPRFREELAHGASPAAAARSIITHTGMANWTAAITTAAALYVAYFTDFLALRELGIIAGTGILLCFLSMLTVLPALLQWHAERHVGKSQVDHRIMPIHRLYSAPRRVLGAVAMLLIACASFIPQVGFNHNLLELQVQDLESVAYERLITAESEQSTWQAVSLAPNLAEADARADALRALPSVGAVEYARDLVPAGQDLRLNLLTAFRDVHATTPPASQAPEQLQLPKLAVTLARFSHQLGLMVKHAPEALQPTLQTSLTELEQLRSAVRHAAPHTLERLGNFQEQFVRDTQAQVQLIYAGMNATPVELRDFPSFFAQRYQGSDGQYALYVTPAADIWDPQAMATFIDELRSVDPVITGVPVEVYEASLLMEDSFYRIAGLSLIAIALLLLLDFRSLRDTCLALTPIAVGLTLLLGAMGYFGIQLNLANFFALPIIIGIGLNDGAQIMHRVRETGGYFPELMTHSTGYGVVLASLTAFASFASLTLASHQGLASLGLILGIGIMFCMVGSTLVLPNVLQLLGQAKSESYKLRHVA